MKKKISLVLAVILSLSVVACGAKKEESYTFTPSKTSPKVETETYTPNIVIPEEKVSEGDIITEETNKTLLESENGNNDDYSWEKTVTMTDDDNKIQTINLLVKENETGNNVSSEIVVNYNEMNASCTSIYENTSDKTNGDISYEISAEDTQGDIESLIPAEIDEGFKKIIAQVIYKAFH